MTNFHNIRFPTAISFGAKSEIHRQTTIIPLAGGAEQRITMQKNARRRYDVGLGVRSLNDLYTVIEFFEARMGQLYTFRMKDWADYKSCPPLNAPTATDQLLGVGNGVKTQFPLQKTYQSGLQKTVRPIVKPVSGTLLVAVGGVATTAYTLNDDTGVLTFTTPPANGANVTAGFEFDVIVRFEMDNLECNLTAFKAGAIPNISLIEVL